LEIYLVSFLAGLLFTKDVKRGAVVGVIVGVLTAVVMGWLGIAVIAAAMPGLLAIFGPQLLLTAFISGLAGAAGGLVRGLLMQQKA
jgi:hypothetical protein